MNEIILCSIFEEMFEIRGKNKPSKIEYFYQFIYLKIEFISLSGKKRDYTSYIGRSLSDLLILGLLQDEDDLSGYLIIKKIRSISQGSIKFRAGTIYPRIEKLHEAGLLDKNQDDVGTSLYSLNKNGMKRLQEKAEEWYFLQDKIIKILPLREELQ